MSERKPQRPDVAAIKAEMLRHVEMFGLANPFVTNLQLCAWIEHLERPPMTDTPKRPDVSERLTDVVSRGLRATFGRQVDLLEVEQWEPIARYAVREVLAQIRLLERPPAASSELVRRLRDDATGLLNWLSSAAADSDYGGIPDRIRQAADKIEALEREGLVDLAAMLEGQKAIATLKAERDALAARVRELEGERDARQPVVLAFVREAFGPDNAAPRERAKRLLEEALELAQATGVERVEVRDLADYTYARPRGEIGQEIGGISVCLLAMAASVGLSADAEERRELARVLAKPREFWAAKHNAKAAAGVADPAPDHA